MPVELKKNSSLTAAIENKLQKAQLNLVEPRSPKR